MRKSFKKCLVAISAVLSLNLCSIASVVNAASPVYQYNTGYGTLKGSINTFRNEYNATTIRFQTDTTSVAPKLTISGSVVDYVTGYTIGDTGVLERSNIKSFTYDIRLVNYVNHAASAFGAHQALNADGSGWVVYTGVSDFKI